MLPTELAGIPFEVIGIDPDATVRDIYDGAVGRRITGRFTDRSKTWSSPSPDRGTTRIDERSPASRSWPSKLTGAPIAQVVGLPSWLHGPAEP